MNTPICNNHHNSLDKAKILADNYSSVQASIEQTCAQAHRKVDTVTLLAVSKYHSAESVACIARLGHTQFAENYFQEAKQKRIDLQSLLPTNIFNSLHWHSIGHIQTKKAKDCCDNYSFLHTVDSEKLLLALNSAFEKKYLASQNSANTPTQSQNNTSSFVEKAQNPQDMVQKLHKQKILLEINIANEEQKAGISLANCPSLIEKVLQSNYLELQGFMCLPPLQTKEGENRFYFNALYEHKQKMEALFNISLPHLSMGTSTDYKEAILEGATFVRIGTDIFGEREYNSKV